MPSSEHDLDYGPTLRGMRAGMKVFGGRYELKKQLGRGGMGVVWLGHDNRLDREVALKFLPEAVQDDSVAVDELKRETRRCLELTHPHIVRIYDFEQENNAAAIAMEFIEGQTLSELRLQRPARVFEVADILPWIKSAAAALQYAHAERNMVHRDLKPANFMLNAKGALKVMDFGIARSVGDTRTGLTLAGARLTGGTLVYMSPQQLMGQPPSVSDDVYSLGATIYELLTGKPPFFRGSIERQIETMMPPSMTQRRVELEIAGVASIPDIWEKIVAACLQKDPAKRPGSVKEIWERLSGTITATPSKPASEPAKAKAATPPALPTGPAKVTPPSAKTVPPLEKAIATQPPPATAEPAKASSPFNAPPPYVKRMPESRKPVSKFVPPAGSAWSSSPLIVPPLGPTARELPAAPPEPARTPLRERIRLPEIESATQVKILIAATSAFLLVVIALSLPGNWFRPSQAPSEPEPFSPRTAQESNMAAATQFAPFTNSLGMSFVPVRVKAGPSAGQLVMFSLWETRVSDYAAHARENGLSVSRPEFAQADDHPVVNVSWHEARSFCDRLTQKERATGRIPERARYRLPSDHEWSCAAGIGEKEDAALPPAFKTGIIQDPPWGSAEIPPPSAGNYSPTLRTDTYPYTAPVSNFTPNRLGLRNMGGNVSEWCGDWYDEPRHMRVLRGASWTESSLVQMRLSSRLEADPNTRYTNTGFRVVLAVEGGTAAP